MAAVGTQGHIRPQRDEEYAQLTIGAARVLAVCEAKREIVDWHGLTLEHDACRTLRALALPYADRPDYREEWRP